MELYSEEFRAGLDLNNNAVYQDFVKYHADGAFWAMVRQGCGFVEEEPDQFESSSVATSTEEIWCGVGNQL